MLGTRYGVRGSIAFVLRLQWPGGGRLQRSTCLVSYMIHFDHGVPPVRGRGDSSSLAGPNDAEEYRGTEKRRPLRVHWLPSLLSHAKRGQQGERGQ
jgi:hypothetical protein